MLINFLIESFNADDEEIEEFLSVLETSVYNFTIEYIKRIFRDINTSLLRKFNATFKKDEQQKNRDWRAMEEQQIRDLFAKQKAKLEEVINDFKYIKIPRSTK